MRYGTIFYIYYLAIYLLDTKYLLKHIYNSYKITIEFSSKIKKANILTK